MTRRAEVVLKKPEITVVAPAERIGQADRAALRGVPDNMTVNVSLPISVTAWMLREPRTRAQLVDFVTLEVERTLDEMAGALDS